LSTGEVKEKKIPDEIYHDFFGGYGLGAKLIYDWTKKGYDPLGPDAILGVVPGLMTGTVAPFSGRYMVCGKSPLTGGWGDANAGGFFGPAIKKSGYDGIFIKGVAKKPQYLLVAPEQIAFKDASVLWGLDAIETDLKLQKMHGRDTKVVAIGQAGEQISLISGLVNDKGRVAARSGLGAVMGAKRLKAIAITKRQTVPVKDQKRLIDVASEYNNYIHEKPRKIVQKLARSITAFARIMRYLNKPISGPAKMTMEIFKTYGTSSANSLSPEMGDSPVKNWSGIGYIDFPLSQAGKIAGKEFLQYKVRSYGCATCPVQCGAILSIPEIGIIETHRPEYETSCMFGTLCLNNDLLSLLKINEICNRAGIDSISTGSAVAFAIECFENGLLTKTDTDGLELHWGDSKAILQLTEQIIMRRGIGDILADGVKQAAKRIGKGSEKFAMHAGGQELPAHDPKQFPSLALTYATDPTPGRHTAASIDFSELGPIRQYIPFLNIPKDHRIDLVKSTEAQYTMVCLEQTVNALGFCIFSHQFGPFPLLELLAATTGWRLQLEELLKIGLRIQTQRLAFSLREGVNPYFVSLPGRAWGEIPHEKGPHKGKTLDYKGMARALYERMGWNPETGIPHKESLDVLGLGSLYADIAHQ
jgi:aldehyde:ferredoxin oxidoreductase